MKRSAKRLQLTTDTLRNLTGIELKGAHGGAAAMSHPTDEMGECGNCNTAMCEPTSYCWPDPPM